MYATDGRPVPPVCESRKPGTVLPGELRDERKTPASRSPRPRRAGPLDAGPFAADVASFELHLAAENKAAGTIRIYTEAPRWFAAAHLLHATGKTRWEQVETQDVQRWIVWLLRHYSQTSACQQYRSLQQFFRWLAAEDEIADPMARLRAPKVAEKPVPFFASVELSKLEKACRGSTFAQRRDAAILAVLTATGIRLAEMPGSAITRTIPARVTWTCSAGRSTSGASAARTGSCGSIMRRPAGSTVTCGPGPGTRRPTGRGYGSGRAAAAR